MLYKDLLPVCGLSLHSFKKKFFKNRNHIYLRCTTWWFGIHSKMITVVKLTSSPHIVTIFLCVIRASEICLSKFLVFSPVLLTIVIMLYIDRSLDLLIPHNCNFHSFNHAFRSRNSKFWCSLLFVLSWIVP